MNYLGAFLVIITFIFSSSNIIYADKPSSSSSSPSSRFPNFLAPLRNIFTKKLPTSHHNQVVYPEEQELQQHQPMILPTQPAGQNGVLAPGPFIPFKFVDKDLSQAETNRHPSTNANGNIIGLKEFDVDGYHRPYNYPSPSPSPSPSDNPAVVNEEFGEAPAAQIMNGRPFRNMFFGRPQRRPFRRPNNRRPPPGMMMMQGGPAYQNQNQNNNRPGYDYQSQQPEYNEGEEFNPNSNAIDDEGPVQQGNYYRGQQNPKYEERPAQQQSNYQRGPEYSQSFQQPQQKRPVYGHSMNNGGGGGGNNMNMNMNGGGGGGYRGRPRNRPPMSSSSNRQKIYPYPSVRGSGRPKQFRPSRPDATHTLYGEDSNAIGFLPSETFNPAKELREGSQEQARIRDTRSEPQIITIEDLQHQNFPQPIEEAIMFNNDIYNTNNGQEESAGRVIKGHRQHKKYRMRGPTHSSYTRPIPVYSLPTQIPSGNEKLKAGQIYQSRPLRSPGGKLHPFNAIDNDNNSNQVWPPIYNNNDDKKLHQKPKSNNVESNEEILYGKPMTMMMSPSSNQHHANEYKHPNHNYDVDTHHNNHNHHLQQLPPSPPISRPPTMLAATRKKAFIKPFLLKATKNPNYKKNSHFTSSDAMLTSSSSTSSEPHQSATSLGFGGGDGGGGDIGHGFNDLGGNGDRILFHVSGHKGPTSYRWGYDTGKGYNRMFRFEEKDETGYVKGKYGYEDKHGKMKVVNYEAHPQNGYREE